MILIEESLRDDYIAHVTQTHRRWQEELQASGFDGVLIAAGEPSPWLFDDQSPPFKANPWFLCWLPLVDRPGCYLWLQSSSPRPILFYHQPQDIWHEVALLEDELILQLFDVRVVSSREDVATALRGAQQQAFIGDVGLAPVTHLACNLTTLLSALDYHRAVKSSYEIRCLQNASAVAVRGHLAAREAFLSGGSEFDIHLAYLAACGQLDHELPYPSIVATGAHGAILHYQNKRRQPLGAAPGSLLIDAGASYNGYGADITRSWTTDTEFAELINGMEILQQSTVEAVQMGIGFTDLHLLAHRQLAQLLLQQGLVRGSVEELLEKQLTSVFLPHGLGHLLGLQVHDRGGWQCSRDGCEQRPPEAHPYLRCTRELQEGFVFTIEPGLYFIPELLSNNRQSAHRRLFDWEKIERMAPFGGIRIEDNIAIMQSQARNLTREAFSAACGKT